MRRLGAVVATAVFVGCLCGCAQTAKEGNLIGRYFYLGATQSTTLTQSSSEHMHSMQSAVDLDARALLDDIDLFWQRDRGTRLSRWHDR